MNIMEEIFETKHCIEILANDIETNTIDQYNYVLQNYKNYIIGNLHPLRGKIGLDYAPSNGLLF